MDGLTVKNGRLINERPVGVTGIQQAANIRRGMKQAKKAQEIAEGIAMAEAAKEMHTMLNKKKF